MIKYFPRTKREYIVSREGYDYCVHCFKKGHYNQLYKWNVTIPAKYAEVMKNEDFTEILAWVHEKIIFDIEDMTYITLNVLIRILTGLLNKCNIEMNTKIELHDIIVSQLRNRKFYLVDKDLPFQLQIIGLVYSS